jgi:hypothetical protein
MAGHGCGDPTRTGSKTGRRIEDADQVGEEITKQEAKK